MIKVGISLSQAHPSRFEALAVAADQLGFESLWLGEHVILPLEVRGELVSGESHYVKPTTPVVDVCAYLSWLAAKTERIRLGSLWESRPAVIVFLRHYGCIFCREHIAVKRRHKLV